MYQLSIVNKNAKGGNVTSAPPGVSCGTDCKGDFDENSSVVLAATPKDGYEFTSWSGCDTVQDSTCTVVMGGKKNVTANFRVTNYTLKVSKSNNSGGVITSSIKGINCGADCSNDFKNGTTIVLTEKENKRYNFTGWSGDCAGTSKTCKVTMDSDINVTANFEPEIYNLKVVKNIADGGMVTIDTPGANCGADCFAYAYSTPVAMITLTAEPKEGYDFDGWTGACTGKARTCKIKMDGNDKVTAGFEKQKFTVTLNAAANGDIFLSSNSSKPSTKTTLEYGDTWAFTIKPDKKYHIDNVTGCGGALSGNTYTIDAVTANCTVKATFAIDTYTLSLTNNNTERGSITATGIKCGSDCSQVYNSGSKLTLTPAPNKGHNFSNWSGCSPNKDKTCTVTMDSDKNISAGFTVNKYALTITNKNSSGGTITGSAGGTNCGANCAGLYDYNTPVTLTASPTEGNSFTGWTGDCKGTGACSVTIDGKTDVTANFVKKTYAIKTSVTGKGGISPEKVSVNHGDIKAFTVKADIGSHIVSVTGCGGALSGKTYTTGQVKDNCTISASFELDRYNLNVTGSSGGTVTSSPSGISCGGDCSETYNYNTSVKLTATPNAGYDFTSWSGGGCSGKGQCTVVMKSDKSVTANFSIKTFTITASSGANGSVSCSPTTVNYGSSSTCTITPGNSNYRVEDVKVDGRSVGAVQSYTFSSVTAPHTIKATFAINTYQLSISNNNTSGGVIKNSTGINCGRDCSQIYNSGKQITLTADPNDGYTFTGWSGSCSGTGSCTVTMDSAKSVTGSFAVKTYVLSVSSANGTVSGSGINCSGNCSATYNYNTSVVLTATESAGYDFTGWSGGGCSGTGRCTVNMKNNKTVTASFKLKTFKITASDNGAGGSISPTGIKTVNYNDSLTFTISPTSKYKIDKVLVDGVSVGAVSSYTFTNITASHTIKAFFKK